MLLATLIFPFSFFFPPFFEIAFFDIFFLFRHSFLYILRFFFFFFLFSLSVDSLRIRRRCARSHGQTNDTLSRSPQSPASSSSGRRREGRAGGYITGRKKRKEKEKNKKNKPNFSVFGCWLLVFSSVFFFHFPRKAGNGRDTHTHTYTHTTATDWHPVTKHKVPSTPPKDN